MAAEPRDRATWENRNFARPEGLWFMRHRDALARWPVLDEAWARRVEAKRLAEEGEGRPERGDGARSRGR
jgi:hypothetical protein